jgi:hypothetical protein
LGRRKRPKLRKLHGYLRCKLWRRCAEVMRAGPSGSTPPQTFSMLRRRHCSAR